MIVDVCSEMTIDCSATAGCRNDSGEAMCFCNSGFELTDNGANCKGKSKSFFNVSKINYDSQLCYFAWAFQCNV